MVDLKKTVLNERHRRLGAKMVVFGGWEMPIQYQEGIVYEHLATRKHCGIFDVSHMGRFAVRGESALALLQHVLTNNAAALELGQSQYTLIPNAHGGAIDDAYLYRFVDDAFLLVVNAANKDKDWAHFQAQLAEFDAVELEDCTSSLSMLSLQGPESKVILEGVITHGTLPEPLRNELSTIEIDGCTVFCARTGYTGEPLCFELFMPSDHCATIWDLLVDRGATPVGLGARDTLRLEAGLPLYGNELGIGPDGEDIPIFSSPLARFAVSFSPLKGNYIGRSALEKQFAAYQKQLDRDFSCIDDLPRMTVMVELLDRGIARAGCKVFMNDKQIGTMTSGTMVPFWRQEGEGIESKLSSEKDMRAIGLVLVESTVRELDVVQIEIRGKKVRALVVPYLLRSEAPPYARGITCHGIESMQSPNLPAGRYELKAKNLLKSAMANSLWRQQDCMNLIPSEQTPSRLTRQLSILDPVCRYAEHKQVKAFCETDVFYYQGTDFIAEVENLLVEEFAAYLGCRQVETRPVSGQMANTAVFSAIVDFINRGDRKREQRRMRYVMNHHIIKGGHLSAQPMGALRDFVARDPILEKPAVVNFPVRDDNPYKIDVEACRPIIDDYRPELIIFGKSMILHKEPVAEIRTMVDELELDCLILYDMAHVLGLVGPFFQQPFAEGADIVTGSTHKTFFGTQRGIIGTDFDPEDHRFDFWEAIQRRSFPGSTSNHHLGTMLGLLMTAFEMNAFKEQYQQAVLNNAKAFAGALKDCGLSVAGDPGISFTETHQVVLVVGYAKGPEFARRLEANNIIVNYQATPHEEGFTASGALRMGVQELTRFGMDESDFERLAQLIAEVIHHNANVKAEVARFRKQFLDMKYCFDDQEIEGLVDKLHRLF